MHLVHRNNQTLWDEIACQRGHSTHATRTVKVQPVGLEPYEMVIFDHQAYGDGPYCPAHDLISRTIDARGAWEIAETAIVAVLLGSDAPGVFIDLGAQIGWFSLLALACGRQAYAYDADSEPLRLLEMSAVRNAWSDRLLAAHLRITQDTPPIEVYGRVRCAKIDIEGAEAEGLRVLWPLIESERVDHILMEVSPVFADHYPLLVAALLDQGYEATVIGRDEGLDRDRLGEQIEALHQANVWFHRSGAPVSRVMG